MNSCVRERRNEALYVDQNIYSQQAAIEGAAGN